MGTHPIFESDFDCLTDFAFSASRNRSEIRDRKLSSIDAENAHHDHSNIARRRHGIWNKFGTSFLERVGHDLVWTDERVNAMRKSQQRESRSLVILSKRKILQH